MATARSDVVHDGEEGVYHCVSRCVRRSFLCGEDAYSGRSFEHRKEWIRSGIEVLAEGYAIEVCAFAIMSSHYHIVIRTRPDWIDEWTNEEVAQRWLKVFPKRKDEGGRAKLPSDKEIRYLAGNEKRITEIRHRLSSVSWFMRCLNEPVARRANKEDGCTGRFWEGRFKCQALLDEAGCLAAMAYVDLNPIRAGLAETPEESEFTSVKERIESRQGDEKVEEFFSGPGSTPTQKQLDFVELEKEKSQTDQWLCPIDYEASSNRRGILPLTLDQYLDLVDWTGRQIKEGKKGTVPEHLAPILTRLSIDTNRWLDTVQRFGGLFFRVAGKLESIRSAARRAGKRWLLGLKASREAFSSP